jgi:hypothetical protein
MSYQLRYDRHLLRQLEDLPGDLRSIARRQIGALAGDPFLRAQRNSTNIPDFIVCGYLAATALSTKLLRMTRL